MANLHNIIASNQGNVEMQWQLLQYCQWMKIEAIHVENKM